MEGGDDPRKSGNADRQYMAHRRLGQLSVVWSVVSGQWSVGDQNPTNGQLTTDKGDLLTAAATTAAAAATTAGAALTALTAALPGRQTRSGNRRVELLRNRIDVGRWPAGGLDIREQHRIDTAGGAFRNRRSNRLHASHGGFRMVPFEHEYGPRMGGGLRQEAVHEGLDRLAR